MTKNIDISDVSETSFITLFCHVLDNSSTNPILIDPKAFEIADQLRPILSTSDSRLFQKLLSGKIDKQLVTHIALRASKYDDYARNFMKEYPDGTIVNIGCGMDTRFWRIDNGKVSFYDLDLPPIIDMKRPLVEETQRYKLISCSVLDYSWIDEVLSEKQSPFLFLAEGVFMYLDADDVKKLVLQLQSRFAGSELVCEVVNSYLIKGFLKKLVDAKMQKRAMLGKDASFRFGISDSNEMENWNPGIQLIDDWSYFDSNEKKLGMLKLFKHIQFFRKTQWTVHYKLN